MQLLSFLKKNLQVVCYQLPKLHADCSFSNHWTALSHQFQEMVQLMSWCLLWRGEDASKVTVGCHYFFFAVMMAGGTVSPRRRGQEMPVGMSERSQYSDVFRLVSFMPFFLDPWWRSVLYWKGTDCMLSPSNWGVLRLTCFSLIIKSRGLGKQVIVITTFKYDTGDTAHSLMSVKVCH